MSHRFGRQPGSQLTARDPRKRRNGRNRRTHKTDELDSCDTVEIVAEGEYLLDRCMLELTQTEIPDGGLFEVGVVKPVSLLHRPREIFKIEWMSQGARLLFYILLPSSGNLNSTVILKPWLNTY